jgi:rfaE bifunctional protein nucleotidyltransferase chain/domain
MAGCFPARDKGIIMGARSTSGKIVSLSSVSQIFADASYYKRIVLVGGCFDVLHIGHIDFLEKAKELGDSLVVLLESDARLTSLKGINRPIHRQHERAKILACLRPVDVVVTLPSIMNDEAYDEVILQIKPAIIATTIGDINRSHKERQAQMSGAELIEVPKTINFSTSKVAQLLEKEL